MFVSMFFNDLVSMSVFTFIFHMNMSVRMYMFVFMSMNQFPVFMFMSMHMYMFMGMLSFNGVFNHKNCSNDHDEKSHIELKSWNFSKQNNSEKYT